LVKEELQQDIDLYNGLVRDFMDLDSGDFTSAYTLSQLALSLADRWNEIMLNSVKYSKELEVTKSEFTNYCYQKFKMLMKIHDFCRVVYRQGSYGIQNSFYGEDML
jgi:hypothetical protein